MLSLYLGKSKGARACKKNVILLLAQMEPVKRHLPMNFSPSRQNVLILMKP